MIKTLPPDHLGVGDRSGSVRIDDEYEPVKNFDWAHEFTLTDEQADDIANPKWLYENLIIQGHVIVIPAPPNGGKTTILFHIACMLSIEGYEVVYVNADISGGDAKPMVKQANSAGVQLLLPDMSGRSMDEVVKQLALMNGSGANFEGVVAFFDTLKKMTDVVSKQKAKELYKLFRSLSAKGMTIVLLAHTNKYTDDDGKPIFEGTADLRSDVDEMIYFEPTKNNDGSMTVTTLPDKVRGAFKPITFLIDADRSVSLADAVIDTLAINKLNKGVANDKPVIEIIDEAIDAGIHSRKDIIEYVHSQGIGTRAIRRVLIAYTYPITREQAEGYEPLRKTGKYWLAERGIAKELRLRKAPDA